MHSSRMRTARSLTLVWGCLSGAGGLCLGGCLPSGGCLSRGVPAQGVSAWGVYIPCDLSHHAFDLTCMLPSHQLRPTNNAVAYILLVGHVTCKVCWDTTPPHPPRWGGGVFFLGVGVSASRGGVCSWEVSQHAGRPPLWTEFLTHASENISLPQLWR